MNFQDPLLWIVAAIFLALVYFHFFPRKIKVEIVKEDKDEIITQFEKDFIELQKLAWLSKNKVERDMVTKLIYHFKIIHSNNPETRYNSQILEGINNRVRREFASQFKPLN